MSQDPKGYTPGVWLWDDPDHGQYVKFDVATSQQVEDRFKVAIRAKTKGPIEVGLSAGPFFGKASNEGRYSCVLLVDCTNPERPVIEAARQTNNNTGYKRKIKRDPPLEPPLEAHLQKIVDNLKGRWEWKDDYAWKEYDLETIAQIEEAFLKGDKTVSLDKGGYFSKQPSLYFIIFNYLSLPASAQQKNVKSKYQRWARRVPIQSPFTGSKSAKVQKQQQLFLKKDKHFLWRKFYAPLSKEDFDDQFNDEKLKANLKCSICLSEFEKKDLLEEQKKGAKATAKKVAAKASNDEDEKSGDKLKHKFDLTKARGLVNNATVIGLVNCSYGHYFHAECILPQLTSKKTCPNCTIPYGEIVGHQPDGRLYVTWSKKPCAGFEDAPTSIKMLFEFPGGIQNEYHPNPGKIYFGDMREVWFPNNKNGRESAMLTRLAFKRKLIFQIGTSLTLGQDNRIVFGSIHLKTQQAGGPEKHGYPDKEFFTRLKAELKVKGINVDLLTENDQTFIENGFPKEMEEDSSQ